MYARSERLKELFKVEILRALQGVKDPGLAGLLTVTDLELSQDKKLVRVYFSVVGSKEQRESTRRALERASPYIRQVLRKRISIKTIPQIVFAYDETPEKASRIDKLLLEISKKDQEK